jgi:hypothetical protein
MPLNESSPHISDSADSIEKRMQIFRKSEKFTTTHAKGLTTQSVLAGGDYTV